MGSSTRILPQHICMLPSSLNIIKDASKVFIDFRCRNSDSSNIIGFVIKISFPSIKVLLNIIVHSFSSEIVDYVMQNLRWKVSLQTHKYFEYSLED